MMKVEEEEDEEGARRGQDRNVVSTSSARSPFRSFLPFPSGFRLGEGERQQRCEGHLPLPPSRTLTKGGHGRTRFMPDREDCCRAKGNRDEKDAAKAYPAVSRTTKTSYKCILRDEKLFRFTRHRIPIPLQLAVKVIPV